MECSQISEMLIDYAMGDLTSPDSDRVEQHLQDGCDTCQLELSEIEESVSTLAVALPAVLPPPALKRDVMQRIRADHRMAQPLTDPLLDAEAAITALAGSNSRVRSPGWLEAVPYIAATLCAFVLGAAAATYWASTAGSANMLAGLSRQQIETAKQAFRSPAVEWAAFHRTVAEEQMAGVLVTDPIAKQLQVLAFDVDPPAEGTAIRLWFRRTNDRWLSVGDLMFDDTGVATGTLDLPAWPDDVIEAVLTEEPVGQSAAPQGRIQLIAPLDIKNGPH